MRGRLFNRALEPIWLDWTLRRAVEGGTRDNQVRDIEAALRDVIPADGTREKVRQTATALWIAPPAEAAEMIAWARSAAPNYLDWRPFHLGALIAAHPFFGDVCAIVGRELALMDDVHNAIIRKRMRATWGDRAAIDISVRAAVQTLRAFRVLEGTPGDQTSRRGEALLVDGPTAAWLAHAVIIHRAAETIDEDAVRQAPELFMFQAVGNGYRAYPLVERHIEGGNRSVLVLR
jgi:hypothetical protein